MGKVFFDSGISLDGFLAGENRGPKNPLGDQGTTIHNWMYKQKAFWKNINLQGGQEEGKDGELIDAVFARTGAYIMGKRMFEEGEVNWPEDLYKTAVYVLSHKKKKPWVQKGSTTFYFINDGIESALEKARDTAKDKDIRIQGGANVIQQYLHAGLVDEFVIHIAPVLLGKGIRLFDHIDRTKFSVEVKDVLHSPLTTHVSYRVING